MIRLIYGDIYNLYYRQLKVKKRKRKRKKKKKKIHTVHLYQCQCIHSACQLVQPLKNTNAKSSCSDEPVLTLLTPAELVQEAVGMTCAAVPLGLYRQRESRMKEKKKGWREERYLPEGENLTA